MESVYVITVVSENTLRVMQRMAGLFARHRLHVMQMNVFETANKGTSYFNIVIQSDALRIEKVVKQLQRIIELLEVKISSQIPVNQYEERAA